MLIAGARGSLSRPSRGVGIAAALTQPCLDLDPFARCDRERARPGRVSLRCQFGRVLTRTKLVPAPERLARGEFGREYAHGVRKVRGGRPGDDRGDHAPVR